ncbi:hypothetical protein [Dietzia sp.]|uniref:hypothetical protein n=1 Tax=Dietzia sp. TaxID=1871616 RepID=UPI002FD980EC
MSQSKPRARRVRPLTIVILVVCALLIVAALSAWRGSESQYGRIPEVRFATSSWSESAEPYTWRTLTDGGGDEVQLSRNVSPEQHLTVGLPPELEKVDLSVLVLRTPEGGSPDDEVEILEDVPAHSTKTLTLPATDEQGLLSGVVITGGVVPVYAENGDEDVLSGEWSLKLTPAPADPAAAPGA